jgi:hypothetical protein
MMSVSVSVAGSGNAKVQALSQFKVSVGSWR